MTTTQTRHSPHATARWLLLALAIALLGGCVYLSPKPVGIGPTLSYSKLPGWMEDRHAEAWPALLQSCHKKPKKDPRWSVLCEQAFSMDQPSDVAAREFFEYWFRPHRVLGSWGRRRGLITGYYEPLLKGSMSASADYPVALYRRPPELLTVDLAELYPELAGKRVRARVEGQKVIPYYDRKQIDGTDNPLSGNELIWVDDPVAAFFLHIQGSGRIQLPNGERVAVGYADQNGHPYSSLGRTLVKQGKMKLEEVNLFSLRAWLEDHPDQITDMLNTNASYVFFKLRDVPAGGPIGSLNVPLTAERSLAVDRSVIPLGLPVWLETTTPDEHPQPYRRLVMAQDTGGAIRGAIRADLFWGSGERAERMAGNMKQVGRLYVLVPIDPNRVSIRHDHEDEPPGN